MRDKVLLEVTVVTDDSTGMWEIGELEYGAHVGSLREYLRDKPANRVKLADWLQMLANKCRDDKAPFQV